MPIDEWAIAGIVVAIIGGGWAIVKAVAGIVRPLTEQITNLNDSIKSIVDDIAELTERNSKTHSRIFDTLSGHQRRIDEHEIRIVKLEEHEKK